MYRISRNTSTLTRSALLKLRNRKLSDRVAETVLIGRMLNLNLAGEACMDVAEDEEAFHGGQKCRILA